MLYCFDPRHAKTIGINVSFLHYLLLTCLSLAAVVGLQAVGIVLVVAMLITPGATAYLLTDKFDKLSIISVISCIISSLIGIYLSYWLDLMLYCFDPMHAKTIGINVSFLHYLLLTCLSVSYTHLRAHET